MELLSETYDGGEEWFDPHPGEDFTGDSECQCHPDQPKILTAEEIKTSAAATPQDPQKPPPPRNAPPIIALLTKTTRMK